MRHNASDALPRSTPEQQGVASSAVLSFLDAVESKIHDLHSFMLLRHGSVIAEGWWRPYAPELPHMLFSLSKSFTSTAVGFAVAERLLSLNDSVLSFFPDDAPRKVSANLAAMRVRHLLTMTTGHREDATDRTFSRRDHRAEKAFLSLDVEHEPGTHFVYNSAASYMLSAVVQKLTGEPLVDYLTPRLFEPLGIEGARWTSYLNGVNFGGFGLSLRTEDIARFGQLYLNKGLWKDRRVIAQSWIEEATARQVPNGESGNPDWIQGYGYQFWRCRPRGVYRGDGAFGQYCIVMPEQDTVIAITSGLGDMQSVLDLVWEHLLPAMEPGGAAPRAAGTTDSGGALEERLQKLELAPPRGPRSSRRAKAVGGVEYAFEPNDLKIASARFDFGTDSCALSLRFGGQRSRIEAGYGEWRQGELAVPETHTRRISRQPAVASGVWESEDVFVVTVREIQTPFATTLRFRFKGKSLECSGERNVAFGPTVLPAMRAAPSLPRTSAGV